MGTRGGRRAAAAVLLASAAGMVALGMGARSYEVRDVDRYAQMAFEMRHSGTFVPTLAGRPYHEAMPLAAWAPLFVASVQGEVTPATARVLPALSGVALVLAVMALAWRHGSPRLGLLAGGFVGLNELFLVYARGSRVDVPLALGIAVSAGAFFHGIVADRPRWFAASGVGLAFAVALKGPMAAVLAAAALLPWIVWEGRGRAALRGAAIALGVAVVLTAAWLVPYLRYLGPEGSRAFFDQMVLRETVEKAESGYGKSAPFLQYLLLVVPHFGPWIAATAAGIGITLRKPGESRPLDRLAVCWTLAPFLLLSIASGKNARYLLPLLPAMAILAAVAAERWLDRAAARWPRGLPGGLAAVAGLLLLAALAAPFLPPAAGAPRGGAWATALLAAAGGGAALAAGIRGRTFGALLGLHVAAGGLVAFLYAAVLATPAVQRSSEPWRIAGDVAARVPPGAPLGVQVFPERRGREGEDFGELGLYLGRWVEPVGPGAGFPGYLLAPRPLPGRPDLGPVEGRGGGPPWRLLGPAADRTAER